MKSLLIIILFLITIPIGLPAERVLGGGAEGTSSPSVRIERKITILDGGYIMINDTYCLTFNTINAQQFYLIGVSKNYHGNIVYLSAHDFYGPLNVELHEEDEAFRWLKVHIRTSEIYEKMPYNFTLTTVFSGLVGRKERDIFRAEFPLYPVLRDGADLCNITLMLPPRALVLPNGYPPETFLNMTSDLRVFNNVTSPLPAYTDLSSWVEFSDTTFSILKVLEVRREISIDSLGRIYVSDLYDIEVVEADSFCVILPPNSTGITVYDAYEMYPSGYISIEKNGTIIRILLPERFRENIRARIAVLYSLPTWGYIRKRGWQEYLLNILVTRPDDWLIPKITVSVVLPEGAAILNRCRSPAAKYEKVGFLQEKVKFEYTNVTRYEQLERISIEYQYSLLWAAFRPTILAVILIGLANVVITFIKPSVKPSAITALSPETVAALIQKYEEMEDILLKIESLREEFMRGKIPRRRYQLVKKTFEEQLSGVRGKLMELKAEIEAAGKRYADMMRQLERASSDIEEARRRIEEADQKLYRREITAEEHSKLTSECSRKIGRAKSMMEEIILKLRLETSI